LSTIVIGGVARPRPGHGSFGIEPEIRDRSAASLLSMDCICLEELTSDNYYFTIGLMIRSFKHRGLKRLYERGDRSGIRPDLLDTVERILTVLDSATTPQALDLPRYRLHPLKGDLRGLWSVTVRANWRIVFRFEGNDAFDVELIDYH
jgi:proteic killer suppression protein